MVKKDMIWNLILIISVIMILHSMTNVADPDKKTAQTAQTEGVAGVGGIVAFAMKKQILWVWPALAAFAALPFIFGQWKNLFFPPAIPSYVWIAGFAVLALIVMRKN